MRMDAGQVEVAAAAGRTEAHRRAAGIYAARWRSYALRHYLALSLLFGAIPFAAAVLLAPRTWLDDPLWSAAAVLLWAALTCAAIWWAGECRCPRCSRRFAALGSNKAFKSIWRGLFDKVCSNCKLRRWEQG